MPGQSGVGVLGVDIGGTKVALRAEEVDGDAPATPAGAATAERGTSPGAYERILTWPGGGVEADVAALAGAVGALRATSGLRFAAVAVAMPGTTDPTGRVTVWPGRPSWAGLRLDETLRRIFPGSRTAWADDGDLAALAEARHVGADDVVYLGVGTGVGGGVVLGGRPLPGTGRGSPEVGHLIVAVDGPRCDCGRHGCLQAIASGPATLRRAGALRGAEVTFAELRDGLEQDRPWAHDAVRPSGTALAAAVVSLGELVDPSVAVLGGGFAAGLPGFVGLVEREVARLARPGRPVPAVRAAALGGLSSLHGAVALARNLC
ncbi:ROK family protein [Micromonospora sp. RTGN7]|uniref:ROK family protein n=1 Tax=Micromonospora sp. RTGN7 TaxID=3016526 RepID=UPI0029FEFED2|nr:ROK family protein [Micromonospora sp. RTGN7]